MHVRQKQPAARRIHPEGIASAPRRRLPIASGLFLFLVVVACSIYANLSFAITNRANLRYLPPYKAYVNANGNKHLGGEYYQIARALRDGKGFAHPFAQPTGPTTWQPPILPLILAGLLWATGSREGVTAVVVVMQDGILIGTTFLVLALVMQTTRRIAPAAAAAVCCAALVYDFRLYFQFTHDWWIVLFAVDLVIAGFCFLEPLRGWKSAAGWGLCGGLCVMINPIVGLAWGILSSLVTIQQRASSRLCVAMLVAALALSPWTIRNYFVFGRFIPSKGNLAFELYQSQCLQRTGLLLRFVNHPFSTVTPEGREYKALGESLYLDKKWRQYGESIRADPLGFVDRVATRFVGATVWYVPFYRGEGMRTWELWICRVTHPLAFLSLLVLLLSGLWQRLHPSQWLVIGLYLLYLMPYIGASYYDRYGIPLLGPKILLVLWAADWLLSVCISGSAYLDTSQNRTVPQKAREKSQSR
jgi:hypothetical protein